MMGATMSDIRLPLDTRRESGDPTPPYAVVHDDAIRAIVERAQKLGLIPIPEIKLDAPPFDKPAAPADDDAIAQRIVTFLKEGWPTGTPALVRNLVAAIRRGEVPGLTTTAERDDAIRQAAEAQDERDTLEAEVERLGLELRAAQRSELVAVKERDAAIARAEKAELEAKAPRGSGWADAQEVRNFKEQIATAIADFKLMQAQRDEQALEAISARAAHAEAMELLRKAHGRVSWKLNDEINEHFTKYGKDASK